MSSTRPTFLPRMQSPRYQGMPQGYSFGPQFDDQEHPLMAEFMPENVPVTEAPARMQGRDDSLMLPQDFDFQNAGNEPEWVVPGIPQPAGDQRTPEQKRQDALFQHQIHSHDAQWGAPWTAPTAVVPRVAANPRTPATQAYAQMQQGQSAEAHVAQMQQADKEAAQQVEAEKAVAQQDAARGMAAKPPLGAAALKPGPGEENLEPEEVQQQRAEAPAVWQGPRRPPTPPSNDLADNYIKDAIARRAGWINGYGLTAEALMGLYDQAVQAGAKSHGEALAQVKKTLDHADKYHTQDARNYHRQFAEARSNAYYEANTPGVWERNFANASPEGQVAMLMAMHHRNPYAGWGNAAVMLANNMSRERQAGGLNRNGGNEFQQRREQILQGPISAAVLDDWESLHGQTPMGQKDPDGVRRAGLHHFRPRFLMAWNTPAIRNTPDGDGFIRQYMSRFGSYDEWRHDSGLQDTPQLRQEWTKYTNRSAKGWFGDAAEWAWNNAPTGQQIMDGALAVGGFLGNVAGAYTGNQQAGK